MPMLKVGDRIINTEAIAHMNLRVTEDEVKITMLSQVRGSNRQGDSVTVSETLLFKGEEAAALRWYFEHHGKDADVMELYYSLGQIGWIR